MKTLEQLLTIGSYAGLGLLLTCTADNKSKTSDSDTEYVSDDSGTYDTGDSDDTDDSGSESCVAWEQTYGGSEDYFNDQFYSVQQTTDGGYVMVGIIRSSETEYYDGLLIKTDENGSKQWEQIFDESVFDFIFSVQQTTDGGYVLAGTLDYSGTDNGWLIKTDENGSKQWEQTFSGNSSYYISSVQQTTDGGYVLAGNKEFSETGIDGLLIKTDENGSKQWEQTFGGSDNDHFNSVQQTTDGGYVLAGITYSSEEENYYVWLIKTDVNGSKQWEQTFDGNGDENIYSVQQTSDGGYVLAGYMDSFGAGDSDGWLIKTDGNGNEEWEQTLGGSGHDRISSVQQTSDGSYVLVGYTGSSGAGSYDGWLVKTDADGNKEWEQTFGGSDSDYISSGQQTSDGGYVLAGYTKSSGISEGWLVKACDK